ncbi:MAG TPA: CBS domain-containing protein [Candidatus Limnocylindrales bacterium]
MSPSALGPSVAQLMTRDPVVVRADASLKEAAALLEQYRISGLPVVDADGALAGVLSQTDLVRARATEHLWTSWPGLAVRHLMTQPALTIAASASLGEAARLMEEHHVHRLVVVADDGRTPIGIISTTDLVRAMAGTAD